MKNLSNVIIIIIGISVVAGAIWFFQQGDTKIVNIPVNTSENNINVHININGSIVNVNSNTNEGIPIDISDLETIEVETDISDLSTIEADLELPEFDFDVSF